jgi:hypothetical protein
VVERLSDLVSIGMLASVFPGELVDEVLNEADARERRSRSLPAQLMVYYLLALTLFAEQGYGEVMRLLTQGLGWLSGDIQVREVPSASAIARARSRLGVAPLAALFERVAGPLATGDEEEAFWHGLRVTAADAVLLDTPDTPENVAFFGRPGGTGRRDPCPQARLMGLGECGTGALAGAAIGPVAHGERMARQLLPVLDEKMLLIGRRQFHSWPLWREAADIGAQLLCSVSPSRPLPIMRILRDGTYVSELKPPGGLDGDAVTVRVIEYEITGQGGRQAGGTSSLITTLLDPADARAEELAAMYSRRWTADVIFRSLKPHQPGPGIVLRSKSPDMARQEIWAMLCVYQAIRILRYRAAIPQGGGPVQRSSIRVVRRTADGRPRVSRTAAGRMPTEISQWC